jgi:NADH:ubiquinone oxidoreductase subunit 6 (subunit J)
VADTNGCGGLTQEMSRGRIHSRLAYTLLVAMALLLTWSANIYQIISYASRAFALYYALQCALASWTSHRRAGWNWRTIAFAALTSLMLAAAVLGVSVE